MLRCSTRANLLSIVRILDYVMLVGVIFTYVGLDLHCCRTSTLFLDKSIDLNSVLIQLRDEVTQEWYKFGLSLGVPEEVMDKYSGYPLDQCMIEMLDYWLRHHQGHPTWREVAKALEAIELHQLSAKILQVYVTGACMH